MLNAQALAQLIKLVLARGLACTVGKEPVHELFAVVGQQLLDFHRTRLVQGVEEGLRTSRCLVLLDRHEHPASGAVDGHKQVAPLRLIGHLRQVLHVHVQIAGFIALEALVRLAGRGRLEGVEVAQAVTAQAAVQARAGGLGADEFAGNGQQVVQRQQQRAAQLHHHALLRGRQSGLQTVSGVRAVLKAGALLPLVDGGFGDAKALGQAGCTGRAAGDLGADGRCGSSVLVQGNHHAGSPAG